MAKGKYYTPEFNEQAVKMAVGLDFTYDQRARSKRAFPCITAAMRAQHVSIVVTVRDRSEAIASADRSCRGEHSCVKVSVRWTLPDSPTTGFAVSDAQRSKCVARNSQARDEPALVLR